MTTPCRRVCVTCIVNCAQQHSIPFLSAGGGAAKTFQELPENMGVGPLWGATYENQSVCLFLPFSSFLKTNQSQIRHPAFVLWQSIKGMDLY
ncbi:hypothetical protein NPIL_121191 [Nephila pilipes]|uniref:Uncharacterized protein n=1 Tax=Nephila pilipes TaxID=299642 RepID=A0A8X6IXA4_NEPPI|nr:hypothetical protein NPIL_121191 [Nephila pilipes]